jgi:hypothetical protein
VGRGGSAAAAGNALDVLIEGAAYFPALEMSKPADPELGNWIWVNASPY